MTTETNDTPPGWKLVPVEPTKAQWGGLARAIMLAWGLNAVRPRDLFAHLERTEHGVPDWLRAESEMQALDHMPSKGTRVAIIYRAMIEDAPEPPARHLPSREEIGAIVRFAFHYASSAEQGGDCAPDRRSWNQGRLSRMAIHFGMDRRRHPLPPSRRYGEWG